MTAPFAPTCPQCQRPAKPDEASDTSAFCAGCRFPLLLVAGKYKLLEELARGGHGVVYKALHMGLTPPQERAIKFIKPARAKDSAVMKRFQREIQVTAALSQTNLHVVRLYDDFGEVPHLGHFYVMEYIEGHTLNAWQSRQKEPLPLGLCAHIFLQLCDVMESAHEKKILHRDLKPNNLMLLPQKRGYPLLKVLDFGIAKVLQTAQESAGLTGNAIGTPLYMSPELCLNRPTDERTDIYAMGLLLFELLVGHSPFVRPTISHSHPSPEESFAAHLYQTPPLLSIVCPPKHPRPEALEAVLAKALAKAPAQRYQNVEALRDAFLDALPPEEAHHKTRYAEAPAVEVTPKAPTPPTASPLYDDTPEPTLPPEPVFAQPSPALSTPGSESPTATLAPGLPVKEPLPTASSTELSRVEESDPMDEGPKRLPMWAGALLLLVFSGGVWGYTSWQAPSSGASAQKAAPRALVGTTKDQKPPRRTAQAPQKSPPTPPRKKTLAPGTREPKTRRTTTPRPAPRKQKVRAQTPRKRLPHRSQAKATPSRRSKPKARVRKAPKRRNPHTRLVVGCPKRALFWVRLSLPKAQRHIRPRAPKATVTPRPDGYCVGVATPKGTLTLEAKGFIPCHLSLQAKLPKNLKIRLKTEGMLEPSSTSYCHRK